MYNWQHKDGANFTYNSESLSEIAEVFSDKATEIDAVLLGLSIAEQHFSIYAVFSWCVCK